MLRWLQLPNLRASAEGAGSRWRRTLEEVEKSGAEVELIVLTGCLTEAGTQGDFEQLDTQLDELCGMVGQPAVLATPGPTELCCVDLPSGSLDIFKVWHRDQVRDTRGYFWRNKGSLARARVRSMFENYSRWWRGHEQKLRAAGGWRYERGWLPGDFSLSVELEGGRRVGLIGLNTVFMCTSLTNRVVREPGIAKAHLDHACAQAHEDWIDRHARTLLITNSTKYPARSADTSLFERDELHHGLADRFTGLICASGYSDQCNMMSDDCVVGRLDARLGVELSSSSGATLARGSWREASWADAVIAGLERLLRRANEDGLRAVARELRAGAAPEAGGRIRTTALPSELAIALLSHAFEHGMRGLELTKKCLHELVRGVPDPQARLELLNMLLPLAMLPTAARTAALTESGRPHPAIWARSDYPKTLLDIAQALMPSSPPRQEQDTIRGLGGKPLADVVDQIEAEFMYEVEKRYMGLGMARDKLRARARKNVKNSSADHPRLVLLAGASASDVAELSEDWEGVNIIAWSQLDALAPDTVHVLAPPIDPRIEDRIHTIRDNLSRSRHE